MGNVQSSGYPLSVASFLRSAGVETGSTNNSGTNLDGTEVEGGGDSTGSNVAGPARSTTAAATSTATAAATTATDDSAVATSTVLAPADTMDRLSLDSRGLVLPTNTPSSSAPGARHHHAALAAAKLLGEQRPMRTSVSAEVSNVLASHSARRQKSASNETGDDAHSTSKHGATTDTVREHQPQQPQHQQHQQQQPNGWIKANGTVATSASAAASTTAATTATALTTEQRQSEGPRIDRAATVSSEVESRRGDASGTERHQQRHRLQNHPEESTPQSRRLSQQPEKLIRRRRQSSAIDGSGNSYPPHNDPFGVLVSTDIDTPRETPISSMQKLSISSNNNNNSTATPLLGSPTLDTATNNMDMATLRDAVNNSSSRSSGSGSGSSGGGGGGALFRQAHHHQLQHLTRSGTLTPTRVVPQSMSGPGAGTQLVPTSIQWCEGGDIVYVAGSFNNWKHKIRMDPIYREQQQQQQQQQQQATNTTAATTARSASNSNLFTDYKVSLFLPIGIHSIKFIVDGEWRLSNIYETIQDDEGRVVNFIKVEPAPNANNNNNTASNIQGPHESQRRLFTPRYTEPIEAIDDPYELLDARTCTQTPPGEYTNEIPISLMSGRPILTDGRDGRRIRRLEPATIPPHLMSMLLNIEQQSTDPSNLGLPLHVQLGHLFASNIRGDVAVVAQSTRYRAKYVTTVYYRPLDSSPPQ
ncbi:AMPKBI-domain-containing protein [Ramicandelaber brevisporus]|nr:AMPKBI-domain-containing protein [Ramicandelaber brevisporus]